MIAPNEKNGQATEVTLPDAALRASEARTSPEDNTAHDPSTCPCNDYGMGLPACVDCRSVFAAKREQLLASLRASEAQGWPDVGLWTLGVDDVDGEPRDTVEDRS